jgi:hypothetical protein
MSAINSKVNRRCFSAQTGYSIIEIILAMGMIVVMLILYTAASNSVILNRAARLQDLASRIAVSSLEDLRATEYASLPSSGALTHPLLSSLPNGTLNLTMEDVDTGLKKATVSVTWQQVEGLNTRNVVLTTYISETGI